MPRTTVYIRNDDLAKWKLIENKAELISQAINRSVITPLLKENGQIKTVQEVIAPEPSPKPQKAKKDPYCEHGQLKGECLWKGCKYA
jgi:hypothetical protein